MEDHGGWIKLWRKIQSHEFYREKRKFSKYEAWIDMLCWANHEDNKFILGNEIVECSRGQFVTSELKMMDHWNWSKEKTRHFLKTLEIQTMILKNSDHKKTTITILNYNTYQGWETANHTSDRPPTIPVTDRQQTMNQTQTIIKNVKKKIILSDDDFLKSLKEKFTWVDFDMEMVKMDAWLLANPDRKKTRKFISRWFIRKEKPITNGKNKW